MSVLAMIVIPRLVFGLVCGLLYLSLSKKPKKVSFSLGFMYGFILAVFGIPGAILGAFLTNNKKKAINIAIHASIIVVSLVVVYALLHYV